LYLFLQQKEDDVEKVNNIENKVNTISARIILGDIDNILYSKLSNKKNLEKHRKIFSENMIFHYLY
jgi:hypothetical protein